MKEIKQAFLTGERALFASRDLKVCDSVFDDGESPLKESKHLELKNCLFRWKYPLWYCEDVSVEDCALFDMARAGIWYTNHIVMKNTVVEAPKNFRRCKDVELEHVSFPNASETLWSCSDVRMKRVTAKGDYFAMNSSDLELDDFELVGNYSFDGVKNVVIRNAKLLTKDAFWNSENVTVYDSFLSGEYLGWNAKNLTLVNCTVESLQGMCYIDGLVMKNCKLIHTNLSFEYCKNIDAEIIGKIDSVKNPTSGRIIADEIGELILESDKVDPSLTEIIVRSKEKV